MRRFRTSAADHFAAPCGPPRRPAGEFPGATSPKCRLRTRGPFSRDAPARPVIRSPCPGRTARIANPLPDKALRWMQPLRRSADRVALQANACCAKAFSPQQPEKNVAPAGPQPARRARERDDSARSRRGDRGNGWLVPAPAARAVVGSGHGLHPRQSSLFPPGLMASPDRSVRRGKARFPSGCESHSTIVAFGW